MMLVIASGKGGTGKTTVSVNLARMLGSDVRLLDCDVEEPNAHLFLRGSAIKEEIVTIPVPQNDLRLAVDMVRELKLPFGVVVNRVGIGDDRVHVYCKDQNIQVLLEIPDDQRIAEAYSRGSLVVDALPEYRGLFLSLIEKTMKATSSFGQSRQN